MLKTLHTQQVRPPVSRPRLNKPTHPRFELQAGTTQADCRRGPFWLRGMARQYFSAAQKVPLLSLGSELLFGVDIRLCSIFFNEF